RCLSLCDSLSRYPLLCTCFLSCSSLIHPPFRSALFPYSTLFRSVMRLRRSSSRASSPLTRAAASIRSISSCSSSIRRCRRRSTRSEEHTSELQSRFDLVCRLLLEKKKDCHIPRRNRL